MSETERSDGVIPSLLRNEQAGSCSRECLQLHIGTDQPSKALTEGK